MILVFHIVHITLTVVSRFLQALYIHDLAILLSLLVHILVLGLLLVFVLVLILVLLLPLRPLCNLIRHSAHNLEEFSGKLWVSLQ